MAAACPVFGALYRNLNRIFIEIDRKTPKKTNSPWFSVSPCSSVAQPSQYLGDYV